ncbi:MAG: hypothetical protein AAB215_04260 [Planctomycetota bacterium]
MKLAAAGRILAAALLVSLLAAASDPMMPAEPRGAPPAKAAPLPPVAYPSVPPGPVARDPAPPPTVPPRPETLSPEDALIRMLAEDFSRRRIVGRTEDIPLFENGIWVCPFDHKPLHMLSSQGKSQALFLAYYCPSEKRYWVQPLGEKGFSRPFVGPYSLEGREGVESDEVLQQAVDVLVADLKNSDDAAQERATKSLALIGEGIIRALVRISMDPGVPDVARQRAKVILKRLGLPTDEGGKPGMLAPDPARELYEYARNYDTKNPSEYDKVRLRYEEVIQAHPGTVWAKMARDRVEDLETDRRTEARKRFLEYKEMAENLFFVKGDYAQAELVMESFIKTYRGTEEAELMYQGAQKMKELAKQRLGGKVPPPKRP